MGAGWSMYVSIYYERMQQMLLAISKEFAVFNIAWFWVGIKKPVAKPCWFQIFSNAFHLHGIMHDFGLFDRHFRPPKIAGEREPLFRVLFCWLLNHGTRIRKVILS